MASVSVDQLSAMIDFLETHQELALGYCNRSKEGRSQARRLWEQCSIVLNSISSNCVQKTSEQWRLYYNEYKSKLLKKIKMEKAEKVATGGGPSRTTKLTPLQERLYNILGRDIGEPLPGVRHNPLSASQPRNSQEEVLHILVDQNSQVLEEEALPVGQNIEVLDIPSPETFEPEIQLPSPNTSQVPKVTERRPPAPPAPWQTAHPPQQIPLLAPRQTVPPAPSQTVPPAPRQTALTTPRRRRRRVQRSPRLVDSSGQEPMREASERLEAMERLSADAIREHAQATIRLAAALEAVAERLREPIVVVLQTPPRSRQRRRLYSSESDDNSDQ